MDAPSFQHFALACAAALVALLALLRAGWGGSDEKDADVLVLAGLVIGEQDEQP